MSDYDDFSSDFAADGGYDDAAGFRVVMSDKEAASVDREPLPAGKYHLVFTDMSIERTKATAKNANKPYINFEFTVQDGKYAGRKCWTNAMCFEPALYTISQILKALGMPIDPSGGEVVIPNKRDFYISKHIWGRMSPNKNNMQDDGTGRQVPRIELMGFSQYVTGESASVESKSSASILP